MLAIMYIMYFYIPPFVNCLCSEVLLDASLSINTSTYRLALFNSIGLVTGLFPIVLQLRQNNLQSLPGYIL